MSGNKNDVPSQGGADTGGKQDVKQGVDQQTDEISSSGRHTNFHSASPESNVNPPGAPQSSHGSATRPIPGGTAGKADGQDTQDGIGGSAGGGAGTSA